MKFEDFELNDSLLESLSYMGFEDATEIQQKAIPEILSGKDMIACAQTGTGKTAAFLLPIMNHLMDSDSNAIQAIILVPTRELAIQIDQQIQGIGYSIGIDSLALYGGGGGDDWVKQKQALTAGASIVVATPGKIISHLQMGYVKLEELTHLILDEADRMLDIGFHEDILKILSYLPKERQTLMFSATMAPKIRDLANKILTDPIEISIAISKPAAGVLQAAFLAYEEQKVEVVKKIIHGKADYLSILIFCSTKKKVFDTYKTLKRSNFNVESISSDLEQTERNDVLRRYGARQTNVLVATDVISRGIDIKDIDLVINFDVPSDAADYVHRVGRTARGTATKGVAITLVCPDDMYNFEQIEKLMELEVPKVPLSPEIGEGPVWKSDNKRPFRGKKGGKGGKKPFYKKR